MNAMSIILKIYKYKKIIIKQNVNKNGKYIIIKLNETEMLQSVSIALPSLERDRMTLITYQNTVSNCNWIMT